MTHEDSLRERMLALVAAEGHKKPTLHKRDQRATHMTRPVAERRVIVGSYLSKQKHPLTIKEIQLDLKIPEETLRRTLQRMVADKEVKTERPSDLPGRPLLYSSISQ